MKRFFLPIILSLLLVACDKKEIVQDGVTDKIVSSLDLSGGLKNLYISPSGSLVEFMVTVSEECDINSLYDRSWCDIESGTKLSVGSNLVKINIQPCYEWRSPFSDGTPQSRTEVLSITDSHSGQSLLRLTINQDHPYMLVQDEEGADLSSHEFAWYIGKARGENAPKKVKIKSNVEWKIENPGTWLELSATSGSSTMSGFEEPGGYDQTEFEVDITPKDINVGDNAHSLAVNFVGTVKDRYGTIANQKDLSVDFSQDNLVFKVTNGNGASDLEYTFSPIVKADYTGETLSILSPDVNWRIVQCPAWLSVSPVSGGAYAFERTITIKPTATYGGETDREVTIEIQPVIDSNISVSGFSKSVNVTQSKYEMILDPSKKITFSNNDDRKVSITANSSGAWRLYLPSDQPWLQASPAETTGLGMEYDGAVGVMSISLAERNYERTPITTRVNLVSTEPGVSRETSVEVEQEGYELELKSSLAEIPVSGVATSKILSVSSSGDWRIEKDVNWITIDQESGNSCNDYGVAISAAENEFDYDRTATITLISKTHEDNGKTPLTSQLKLTQRRYEFEVSATELNFGAIDSSEKSIDITCSATNWSVSKSAGADWVTISPMNGTLNGRISISVKNNTGTERQCSVQIANTDKPNDIKTVVIKQEKYVFDVTISATKSLPAATANTNDLSDMQRTFSVTCSPGLTYSISCSYGKVSGDTVTFDYNPTNETRRFYVTVKPSVGNAVDVQMSQNGLVYTWTDDELGPIGAKKGSEDSFVISACSFAWEVAVNCDWLDVVDDEGQSIVNVPNPGTSSYAPFLRKFMTTNDNLSSKEQKGEIWVGLLQSKTGNGKYGVYKKYIVTREGIKLETNLTDNAWTTGTGKLTKTVTVTSDFGWGVSVVDSANNDWISVEKSSDKQFSITVEKNETGVQRQAKIYLDSEHYESTKDAGLRKEIIVTQNGK